MDLSDLLSSDGGYSVPVACDSGLGVSSVRVCNLCNIPARGGGLVATPGPGGVRSGVGGLCWFGGVIGGPGVITFSRHSSGLAIQVGLQGMVDCELEELLE